VTQLTETVSSDLHDGVGVILIDNPPVNAIAPSVREGIDLAVQQFAANDRVSAVVLHCAGSTFMAGADIRKLGTVLAGRPTSHIIESLESLPKPVIAALQGNALGGGLEYALGCHYRCALPGTRLGLPEVNLGVIPGAGGTQRIAAPARGGARTRDDHGGRNRDRVARAGDWPHRPHRRGT
jgi:3-hydroxyacyl-CoA dehydrogenase